MPMPRAAAPATAAPPLADAPAPAAPEDLAALGADPLAFVRRAFPWGTGVLAGCDGPRAWQAEFLADVGRQVGVGGFDGGDPVAPLRHATASGHGIGKSALVAWLILWILSTRPHAKGVVTANTAEQLKTKTWGEMGKWHRLCATRGWFAYTASKGNMSLAHRDHPQTWRVDAQTCREENSESFAGLHAAGSTPFFVFDEASAVPDIIWEVAEGGMTDGEPMWFVFGNPTRTTGRFHSCFGRFRHRWHTRQIDSRTVEGTNKDLLEQWIGDYGEESDFVRVRIQGRFPRAGSMQFIAADTVEAAAQREAVATFADPVLVGVDVARFGDDESVICIRRGRDARTVPLLRLRGVDTMTLAGRVAELIAEHRPDAVFVDGGGVGGGVVDRLRQLGHAVVDVQFGARSDRGVLDQVNAGGERYANKRAEMWGAMRAWLKSGGAIPDDAALAAELTAVEYGFNADNAIQLERKEDMKKRGLASPDAADAIALTFAYPVAARGLGPSEGGGPHHRRDYDPFA